MRVASTESTTPSRRATMVTPESRATCLDAVPMSGERVRMSGTACRGMFEPMRARSRRRFEERMSARPPRDELVRRHVHDASPPRPCHHGSGVARRDELLGELALLSIEVFDWAM